MLWAIFPTAENSAFPHKWAKAQRNLALGWKLGPDLDCPQIDDSPGKRISDSGQSRFGESAFSKMSSLHLVRKWSDFGHYLARKWSKKGSPELGGKKVFPLAFFISKNVGETKVF